jgi:hypothetical protein
MEIVEGGQGLQRVQVKTCSFMNAWYVLPVGEMMGHKSLRVRPRGCSGEHPAPTTGTRGTYWASRMGLPTEENLDFIRY